MTTVVAAVWSGTSGWTVCGQGRLPASRVFTTSPNPRLGSLDGARLPSGRLGTAVHAHDAAGES